MPIAEDGGNAPTALPSTQTVTPHRDLSIRPVPSRKPTARGAARHSSGEALTVETETRQVEAATGKRGRGAPSPAGTVQPAVAMAVGVGRPARPVRADEAPTLPFADVRSKSEMCSARGPWIGEPRRGYAGD